MKSPILSKTKISIIFLLVFFSPNILISQSGWILLQSGTTESLTSVCFVDTSTGFCGGSNGTILRTTNSGQNWIKQQVGTNMNFFSMSFPSINTGYVVGGNLLIKTTNRGLNWNIYSTNYLNAWSVFFIDNNTGFVAANDTGGTVFKTDNGGLNWFFMHRFDTCFTNQTFFIDQNTGFILGHTPNGVQILYKTTDAGYNWSLSTLSLAQFNCMFFNNISTGFIAGNVVWKTTDSGLSWNQFSIIGTITGIYFPSINTGYSCGFNGIVNKTINAGVNWISQQNIPTNNHLSAIQFINSLTGYAIGDSGTIIKTITGGEPIGIKPIGKNIPENYQLFQNFPNPFNPSTKIRITIPKKSYIKLKIYDVLGRFKEELIDKELIASEYEVTFNASSYSSGVYFYQLIANNQVIDTKKLTIIK